MAETQDQHDERRSARRHTESSETGGDRRSSFQKDRDRILYSDAFRRLGGVTQVAASDEIHLLHNRLTHSLKVGQIGRRIAERLLKTAQEDVVIAAGGLDPDVVEAGGIAHDLGHPPFGHIAEEELDDLMQPYGGFEGNAQSFRIVTKLEVHRGEPSGSQGRPGPGLDLTRATMNAILKYPTVGPVPRGDDDPKPPKPKMTSDWTDRDSGTKWGAYQTENVDFDYAREPNITSDRRCPEAILVDWADDVTYAVHDLQDFFRAGAIPPISQITEDKSRFAERCRSRMERLEGFNSETFDEALETAVANLAGLAPRIFRGSRTDLWGLKYFANGRLPVYLEQITLHGTPPFVHIPSMVQYEVEILKSLTWFYVIDRPPLASLQVGQRRVIRTLFETLLDWASADLDHPRIPARLRDLVDASKEDVESKATAALSAEIVRVEQAKRDAELPEGPKRDAARPLPGFHAARAVCDYIAMLTEAQAIDLHARITGNASASMFGSWFGTH